MLIKWRFCERSNWFRHMLARSLDWDLVVFLEVDAGLLLERVVCHTEKFSFYAWVRGTRDVFAIYPFTVP
jgi:hypothetical protein